MWLLPFSKRYYLLHPLRFLKHMAGNIKWAWQRVIRGWDDKEAIDINWYLSVVLPPMLDYLKENGKIDWDLMENDVDVKEQREWESAIYDIRVGFLASRAVLDFKYGSQEELDFLRSQCDRGLTSFKENYFRLSGW